MKTDLPVLDAKDLAPTRDWLKDVALAMSSLQRGFLPKHPRSWQYGLEVAMRGIYTQPFNIGRTETRAIMDLVKHELRFGNIGTHLEDYSGLELFNNFEAWLELHNVPVKLVRPKFNNQGHFDGDMAEKYAEALWWLDKQFRILKAEISEGITSPILLYPHHFDLAMSWFPDDDERQMTIGWSTGDEHINEPYIYLTAYPELDGFMNLQLPDKVYWQKQGFNGAVLNYADLQQSGDPEKLFSVYKELFGKARQLFD